jgi:diguanylate cyclase (GGDEF)-like protein
MNTVHLAYMITEGYLFIFAFMVFLRLNSNLGSQREVRELRNMIYSYFGMLLFDIISYLFEDGYLAPPLWVAYLTNCLCVASISLGCYFWFRFVDIRLNLKFSQHRTIQILLLIPLVFILVSYVASIWTGWLFTVDETFSYESTQAFNIVATAVNYFYLVIPTVASIYMAIKTKSHLERNEYITYSIYMVAPLTAGLVEEYLPSVPILALNIFMVIHILFLMIQSLQIYNDALTNLDNRRHLNLFLEERLGRATSERPVYLFMMDINGFKAINDKYGHVEGDNALKLFASVLRLVGEKHHAFVARYGGDEFCIVADGADQDPEAIASDLLKTLLDAQHPDPAKPMVTVSLGYAALTSPKIRSEAAIAEADARLYEKKKEWHLVNKEAA